MPPGRVTRTISATPCAGSGTKKITSAITAASKRSASIGSAIASACVNCARRAAGRLRANANWPSEGSIPCTSAGAHRSTSSSVNAPLPQPTSIQRSPAGGASQSRNTSPARRLQTPIIRS
jgi:hypothetical protein